MIFHLLASTEWAAAKEAGEVRPASLVSEGFAHCSTSGQLEGVVGRFYAGVADDLVVLSIDPAAVGAELRWEAPAHAHDDPEERFPHLYGPIPVTAVTDAVPWPRWRAGS